MNRQTEGAGTGMGTDTHQSPTTRVSKWIPGAHKRESPQRSVLFVSFLVLFSAHVIFQIFRQVPFAGVAGGPWHLRFPCDAASSVMLLLGIEPRLLLLLHPYSIPHIMTRKAPLVLHIGRGRGLRQKYPRDTQNLVRPEKQGESNRRMYLEMMGTYHMAFGVVLCSKKTY
jgi:hypothetical protein